MAADLSALHRLRVPAFVGGFQICDLGTECTEPLHKYGPAVRDYALVHFVLRGKGSFKTKSGAYALHENQCFYIAPDAITEYRADKTEPWEYAWIGLRGALGEQMVRDAFGLREVSDFDEALTRNIRELFTVDDEGYSLALRTVGLFTELLSSVYRRGDRTESDSPDIVRDAINIMENGYHHQLNVAELANGLGMSRAHFITVFGNAVGVSPYKYITELRLRHAAELVMRTPHMTVEEIAYSVGFTSVQRFSEMFKNKYGVSPLKYRAARSK